MGAVQGTEYQTGRAGTAVLGSTGTAAALLWIAAAALVSSLWAVRAFVPGPLRLSLLLAGGLGAVVCASLCAVWFGGGLSLARRHKIEPGAWPEHSRMRALLWPVASAATAPLLLFGWYLPEYLLGARMGLLRSLVLLSVTAALAVFLFRLASRPESGTAAPAWAADARLSTRGRWAFAGVLAFYFLLTTVLSLRKLATLGYAGQDLAYFSQIFYTTLHGRLFASNFYQDLLYTRTVTSDFAGHNSPIQYLFVLFYRICPTPGTNLVVRDLMMTLSALPAYVLARTRFRPAIAATLAAMFLFVPAIFFQNLFEFYPFSLAAFFLLLAFACYARGRFGFFVASLLLTLLVREDLVFAVLFFGLLALGHRRSKRWVGVPLALGIAWAFLSWGVVLPHFLAGAPFRSNVCFAHLGSSTPAMLHSILHHPTATVLTRDNLIYLKQLFSPFGMGLSWLAPAALGSLPYLAINLLGGAGECPTTSIFSQHAVAPTVFLFAGFLAALASVARYASRFGISARKMTAAVVALACALTVADLAFVTYPEQFQELRANPITDEAREVASLIPAQAAVAAPRYMCPLLANRMALYMTDQLLDYHHPEPQYVIVDRDFARMRRTPKWRPMYDRVTALLRADHGMTLVYQSPNYLVYQRTAAGPLQGIAAPAPGGSPLHE